MREKANIDLSKKAREVLRENDYHIQARAGEIMIRRKSFTRFFIILLTSFLTLGMIVIGQLVPLFGLILLILIWVIAFVQFRNTPKNTTSIINLGNNNFQFQEHRYSVKHISTVNIMSELIDEYASAEKETNEEYLLSISLEIKDGQSFKVFALHSDYREPTQEILEIFEWLKKLLKTSKE